MAAIQTIITQLKAGSLSSGKIALAALAGYPSDATKFARGDGTWAVPSAIPGAGSVTQAMLATAIMQGKRIESGIGSTNGSGDLTISFGTAFGSAPAVICNVNDSQVLALAHPTTTSTTGATIHAVNSNTGAALATVSINWIAIG